LKDALVGSDEKNTGIAAGALQASLMETSHKEAADFAAKIASASTLKAQREPFNALSSEIEKIVKAAKISGGTVDLLVRNIEAARRKPSNKMKNDSK